MYKWEARIVLSADRWPTDEVLAQKLAEAIAGEGVAKVHAYGDHFLVVISVSDKGRSNLKRSGLIGEVTWLAL